MDDPSITRRLELSFCHCEAKSPAQPNEDSFAYDEDRQLFVISDGASISFDSALWSKLVVENFIAQPSIDADWFAHARQQFASAHSFDDLPWNKQAAYERGSFATLLGLAYDPETGKALITGVGDSIVVMIDNVDGWVTSFPYEDASQFRQDPVLLSTNPGAAGLPETALQPFSLFELPGTITLLLMTDALGAWCLEHGHEGAVQLAELTDVEDFREFLQLEQRDRRMRVDDATLMVLKLSAAP